MAARNSIAAEVVKELQARLPAWIRERDVPGVAIAVVNDKRIVWQEVYGFTSRVKDRPVTPRTLFAIMSMSKSFTVLGVLTAVQDGLLDLDRPITDYLPDFTVHSRFEESPERKMTLRHLLSHRAGFTHEAPAGGNYDSRPLTFAEHILSLSDTWLRYPVGYRNSYSNIGVDLAGWILEKKTGVPFAKYIGDKILAPLGMNDSTLDIGAILKAEDRALGNTLAALKVPGGIPVEMPMVPAGGAYSNILDMARYLAFHINKGRAGEIQFLRRDLIEDMHAVQFPEEHERFGYGLGLVSAHLGPETCLTQGGGGYGFSSLMTMYMGLKLGLVVLTNAEKNPFVDQVDELVNKIIEARVAPPGAEYEKPAGEMSRPIPPGDERVKKLAGFYTDDVHIGAGQDGIFGITMAKKFYPLTFYADADEGDGEAGDRIVAVFGKSWELRAKPPLGDGQPGTMVVLNRPSGTCEYYDFIKPEPAADKPGPNKSEWKPYLGSYRTLVWGRASGPPVNIGIAGGYLTLNGTRCREHLAGLFFTPEGEALDFRGTVATFRNILLIRTGR